MEAEQRKLCRTVAVTHNSLPDDDRHLELTGSLIERFVVRQCVLEV